MSKEMKHDYTPEPIGDTIGIRKHLEGKSIYEMNGWVRAHAQYLKWCHGYSKDLIDDVIQPLMRFSYFLNEKFPSNQAATDLYREFCVMCMDDLETGCQCEATVA